MARKGQFWLMVSNQDGLQVTTTGRVGLVPRENIPARPASDWSIMRIYSHVLHLIGHKGPLPDTFFRAADCG
eukprot:4213865-Pyramimonas_sp.AAC.1